jgi:hypothetical protein
MRFLERVAIMPPAAGRRNGLRPFSLLSLEGAKGRGEGNEYQNREAHLAATRD